MWPNPQKNVDLVTFTEEILSGKFDFLCSVRLIWKAANFIKMIYYWEKSFYNYMQHGFMKQ